MATPLDPHTKLVLAAQQQEHDQKLSLVKQGAMQLKASKAELEARLDAISRGVRHRVGTGVSTAITLGSMAAAGYADGWLEEKKAAKIGPVKITTVLGLVAAALGVYVNDADAAEASSAIGRGLAGGPIYESSKAAGAKRAQTSNAAKAPVEAAAAAAAPGAKK